MNVGHPSNQAVARAVYVTSPSSADDASMSANYVRDLRAARAAPVSYSTPLSEAGSVGVYDDYDPCAVSYISSRLHPAGAPLDPFCIGQNVLAMHNKAFRMEVADVVPRRIPDPSRDGGKDCCTLL